MPWQARCTPSAPGSSLPGTPPSCFFSPCGFTTAQQSMVGHILLFCRSPDNALLRSFSVELVLRLGLNSHSHKHVDRGWKLTLTRRGSMTSSRPGPVFTHYFVGSFGRSVRRSPAYSLRSRSRSRSQVRRRRACAAPARRAPRGRPRPPRRRPPPPSARARRRCRRRRVCDATLQMIGEISPEWSQKLMAEKFR